MNEIIGRIIIGVGLVFDVFGCIGLIRMPDLYNRLQAATKCVTFGTCSILFGAFIICGFNAIGIKALLGMVFVAITSPTAAHAIARGAYLSGVKLWGKSTCDKYGPDKDKCS